VRHHDSRPRTRPLRILRLALADYLHDEMTTYAAALAYRVLFSLFPFLVFLTSLLGFFGAPQLFEWMRDQAAYVLPAQAMDLVNIVLSELRRTNAALARETGEKIEEAATGPETK